MFTNSGENVKYSKQGLKPDLLELWDMDHLGIQKVSL